MKEIKKQHSSNYYDNSYVNSQNSVAFNNKEVYEKIFVPHCKESMTVLDFGAGAGVLLQSLRARKKIAVDINLSALELAKAKGAHEVYPDLDSIELNSVDLIVSNSALEHVPNPREILVKLKAILKNDGRVIMRIPHETLGWNYKPGDWNYHLYTWSPMAIGNLFNDVGFSEIKVKIERSKTAPFNHFWRAVKLNNFMSTSYRIFRLILDELNIKPIAVDGYSIVEAVKRGSDSHN